MAPVFPKALTSKRPADQPWSYWDDEPVEDGPDEVVIYLLTIGRYAGPSSHEERLAAAQILHARGLNCEQIGDTLRVTGHHVQYLLGRYVCSPRRLKALAA